MNKKKSSQILLAILIAMMVFGLDWISKYWVSHFMAYGGSIPLIPFFKLTYVHNEGAAFSIFLGKRCFLISIAAVISIAILYLIYRNNPHNKLENIGLTLILGGAIGNLYDRVYHGYVIDYFHFYIGDWSYPIFNIADCAICIGVGLFLLSSLLIKKKPAEK